MRLTAICQFHAEIGSGLRKPEYQAIQISKQNFLRLLCILPNLFLLVHDVTTFVHQKPAFIAFDDDVQRFPFICQSNISFDQNGIVPGIRITCLLEPRCFYPLFKVLAQWLISDKLTLHFPLGMSEALTLIIYLEQSKKD